MKERMSQKTIGEWFFNFFPPPAFLNIKITGVDISDSSVKVLALKYTQEGSIPDFFEQRKISPGIVHQGEVEDPESLITVLTALRRKYDMNFIRVSLPEEKTYLFQTTVPNSQEKEQIRNSIEFQLEKHVPIPPSESIFDYDVIKKNRNTINVSVTVFPKTIITDYQKIFKLAGLTPVSFELGGQAIAKAVIPEGDAQTYMIVDFGRTRSGISIVKDSIVRFSSTVDVGGNELIEAIMKYFKVNEIEAQKIKNQKGFFNKEDEQLHNSLMGTISTLRDEINRHFIYWNTKDTNRGKEDKINKIILCGGNASLAGLTGFLSLGIKAPVERAQVWQNAFSYNDYIPPMNYEVSLPYATVIGLTLI